jgi:hypothetical protein
MNLDNLTNTEGCIVTKNEPSFYYDSGLEPDLKKPIEITILHDDFQSVFDCVYDCIIIFRGDTLERYYCKSYIQGRDLTYCLDFKFTMYRNIVNNTYYVDNDEENILLQYPTDFGGTVDYYFIDDILTLLFFNPPRFEQIYY